LLTKFALAQFTARLFWRLGKRLFWRLENQRHLAFDIFDAVTTHTITGHYARPIHTSHYALPLTHALHGKAASGSKPAALPYRPNDVLSNRGVSNRSENDQKAPARLSKHTPTLGRLGTVHQLQSATLNKQNTWSCC
jgi:hypothetical protein